MPAIHASSSSTTWRDPRHGPLIFLLLALTIATGLVDAVSFIALGHVFVANMTGNVVFLAFAVAEPSAFSVPASLTALAAYAAGAFGGGWLGARGGMRRGNLIAASTLIEAALASVALAALLVGGDLRAEAVKYVLIILLAIAMGLQNAVARKLAIPDLNTSVITMTLTGLAADAINIEDGQYDPRRRLLAVALLFAGAAVGGVLVHKAGIHYVLALLMVLLLICAAAAWHVTDARAAWNTLD